MIGQRGDQMNVEAMCEVLDVSSNGYYASRQREVSAHQESDAQLGKEIERVFSTVVAPIEVTGLRRSYVVTVFAPHAKEWLA